jgi:Type II CAAX prenyl endopeptidase Rce1-like
MRRPRPLPVSEHELEHPTITTIGKLLYNTPVRFLHDRVAAILGSSFLVLMLWGQHGNLELLHGLWSGWKGPGSDPATRGDIVAGIPWDQEWLSFWAGALIVVGIPCLLIRFAYHQRLRDYGLGLPPANRRKLAAISALLLFAVPFAFFWIGGHDPGMQATYPLFRGDFDGAGQFIIYELGYLPFFVAIEFIFRGYLLLGLYRVKDRDVSVSLFGASGPLVFGYYAILISMLSYTAWHLGKPEPELWGTIVWGLVAGTIVLVTESVLPIIAVHWLLNVWLDLVIWQGW